MYVHRTISAHLGFCHPKILTIHVLLKKLFWNPWMEPFFAIHNKDCQIKYGWFYDIMAHYTNLLPIIRKTK